MLNKEEQCHYTFDSIETIAQELEELANKIRLLKDSVQNPSYIQKEDFDYFCDNCSYVRNEMDNTFNRTYNNLKCIFNQVYSIYNGE